MKTAVEWLRSQIVFESVDKELLARWDEDSDLSEYFEQALQMEKEQVIEARNNGFMASAEGWNGEYGIKDFNLLTEEIKSEEYFNKTFKTK
jgi:hypothetical protein